MVRQAALHVWKVVVTHTARTLREILPTLVALLLTFLGSENSDKSKVAARTLGDLVRKLGERVLPEIIPMLEKGLTSSDTKVSVYVCILHEGNIITLLLHYFLCLLLGSASVSMKMGMTLLLIGLMRAPIVGSIYMCVYSTLAYETVRKGYSERRNSYRKERKKQYRIMYM